MPESTVVQQPEIPEVARAVPAGTDLVPVKAPKAVSKIYFVANGEITNLEDNGAENNENVPYVAALWDIVHGSEDGFRTKDEVAKFVKTLPPGEYTLLTAATKKIAVMDVRRVKGV